MVEYENIYKEEHVRDAMAEIVGQPKSKDIIKLTLM